MADIKEDLKKWREKRCLEIRRSQYYKAVNLKHNSTAASYGTWWSYSEVHVIKLGSKSRQDPFKEGETGIPLPAASHHKGSVVETTCVGTEGGEMGKSRLSSVCHAVFLWKERFEAKMAKCKICSIFMQVKKCPSWVLELLHYLMMFLGRDLGPLGLMTSPSILANLCAEPSPHPHLTCPAVFHFHGTCFPDLLALGAACFHHGPNLHDAISVLGHSDLSASFCANGAPGQLPTAGLPFRRRVWAS